MNNQKSLRFHNPRIFQCNTIVILCVQNDKCLFACLCPNAIRLRNKHNNDFLQQLLSIVLIMNEFLQCLNIFYIFTQQIISIFIYRQGWFLAADNRVRLGIDQLNGNVAFQYGISRIVINKEYSNRGNEHRKQVQEEYEHQCIGVKSVK